MNRNKEKKRRYYKIIFIIILVLFSTILSMKLFKYFYYDINEEYVKMSISEIYHGIDFSIIKLSHSCYYFEFYTTKDQGNLIEMAYKNVETKRPLTHEIIINIMNKFWIEPELVRIDKVVNDTYYATLVLKSFFKYEEIDIRPSDGIVIALRTDIPIYVNKYLVKNNCDIKSF